MYPIYQNHNAYLKSIDRQELYGQPVDDADRRKACQLMVTRVATTNEELVPCGLEATSLFNDTFAFDGKLDFSDQGIAWQSDLDKFANPSDYKTRPSTSWLYQRYPDVVKEEEGVKNEHFVTWMRPAALPQLYKPYGH